MAQKKRRKVSTRAKANLRRKGRKIRPASRSKTIIEIFDGSAKKLGRTARKLTNKAISKIRSIKFL